MVNYERIKDEAILWIRDWFQKNGPECNAVIGISGGKDSTIAAALCKEALGADRVIGVSIPDRGQDDVEATKVAEVLGIRLYTFPIGNITREFENSFISMVNYAGSDAEGVKRHQHAQQNLPPRVRMAALYFISQSFNGRVVNTCNLSEDYIGYSSIWGDSVGDFSPMAKLTVSEIREIGELLGLPEELVWKTPDDGLPHSKPDEEKFGFSYETLDRLIRYGECGNSLIYKKIMEMHEKSEFKRKAINLPTFDPGLEAYPNITRYYGD